MSYFLFGKNLNLRQEVKITGTELKHLFSRRVKKGEVFNLQGPDFKRFESQVLSISPKSIRLKINQEIIVPKEPSVQITLCQAYVNEKALDFILQKSTELRAIRVILFSSTNTALNITQKQFENKQERWNKILVEAAKQCDRIKPPDLEFVANINSLISELKTQDKVFLMDIGGKPLKTLALDIKKCSILIGPEGGFTKEEKRDFTALQNIETFNLGPILLRAETAALSSLAILQSIFN